MKAKLDPRLKLARVRCPFTNDMDDQIDWFEINGPCSRRLFIIAANGDSWDHVSVSVVGSMATPNWDEMCFVKDLFFEPEEAVFQLHPPHSRYVNVHAGYLHLWRPQHEAIPMPLLEMV